MRKATVLSTHSRQIEDSLVRNAPVVRARDVIAGENKICPFKELEWLKMQSFQELE